MPHAAGKISQPVLKMRTLHKKQILFALALCWTTTLDAAFVTRIVDTVSPSQTVAVSLAFDGDNRPLVAYRKQDNVVIARTEQHGYIFDLLPPLFPADYLNLEVTSHNEWWLMAGASFGSVFGAKSSWFDWTFAEMEWGTAVEAVLSDNDILHSAVINGNALYHRWFDVKSNRWLSQHLGFCDYSLPGIDVRGEKVLISGSINGKNTIIRKSENGYFQLPVFAMEPLSFQAAFDAEGRTAVAYSKHGKLVYTIYADGIGWIESHSGLDCHSVAGLKHSRSRAVGVVYIHDGTLYCATNAQGAWTSVLVDDGLDGHQGSVDFRFDKADKPVIAYVSHDGGFGGPVVKLAGVDMPPYNITDIDGNGVVNLTDFAAFAAQWAKTATPEQAPLEADFDGNGEVDIDDLRIFVHNWLWNAQH